MAPTALAVAKKLSNSVRELPWIKGDLARRQALDIKCWISGA